MAYYYVNVRQQKNGDNEVHVSDCGWCPADGLYVGEHGSCHGAVSQARLRYPNANGCAYCCADCHTG